MPCVAPIPAHRPVSPLGARSGRLVIGSPVREMSVGRQDDVLAAAELLLPCGSCVGCQISRAREWAIRCTLEVQLASVTSFLTLTYSDSHVPYTLSRGRDGDLSRFFRYLRRDLGEFRFFACGEYGDRGGRPHYHALVFGVSPQQRDACEAAWAKGFVTAEAVTDARISYTAGYCAKKLGHDRERGSDVVDYSTGEYLGPYEPPFLQMSRRPGIGGDFRRYWRSWRKSAIWQGREFPVPRYLAASFRESASDSELARLELEKVESRMVPTIRELDAHSAIAESRISLRTQRSQL